jgi:hypothetical protein
VSACLRHFDHVGEVAVHERLAAGEADFCDWQRVAGDFIEIERQIGACEVRQRIVGRRAFDIAVGAGEVAQRAGVEPEGLQRLQRDMRAGFALGGNAGIAELCRVKRGGGGGKGRGGRNGGGSCDVMTFTQRCR